MKLEAGEFSNGQADPPKPAELVKLVAEERQKPFIYKVRQPDGSFMVVVNPVYRTFAGGYKGRITVWHETDENGNDITVVDEGSI